MGNSRDDYNFDVSVGNLVSGEKIELKSEYVQMIRHELLLFLNTKLSIF